MPRRVDSRASRREGWKGQRWGHIVTGPLLLVVAIRTFHRRPPHAAVDPLERGGDQCKYGGATQTRALL